MTRGKTPAELQPGDLIRVHHPGGEARVTRAYRSEKTMAGPGGRIPRGTIDEARAWIVCFEMVSGSNRGDRLHTFQHPNDRISIA